MTTTAQRNLTLVQIVLPNGKGRNFFPADPEFAAVAALTVGKRLNAKRHFFSGFVVYEVSTKPFPDGLVKYVLVH